MSRFDWVELLIIVTCLIFTLAISLYHISFNGFLSLSESGWGTVWAISENGLSIIMSIIIAIYSYGSIKKLFKYLFIPYFSLKLIYHASCYSGLYLMSKNAWESFWSIVMIIMIIVGFCLILIQSRYA